MTELNVAISSRKSLAADFDNISPAILKYLFPNTLDYFLNTLNNVLKPQQFFYHLVFLKKSFFFLNRTPTPHFIQ